ncbi:MAG: aminotransferase class III-fold pyridoxal phosphate-dependent enzyme [Chloroflexota bacterium]|nr:aminotransferase class III-fold pyridoxal phosphate-dependent enzyme [Chloroflexota bacterium]
MATDARRMTIDEEMYERMAGSAALYERATKTFPSGVTHDSRYATPFPIYVTRARGSRKWDVDGNEYVDYFGGHGALLLGHCHPAVTEAVVEQAQKGSHYGASHELEVRWGELVNEIVPSSEAVKFTSSGTEATMMAMRLARAFTGRDRIVKVQGHFHGWHDYAAVAMLPPWDVPISVGIPKAVQDTVTGIPDKDVAALDRECAKGDVAGVIIWCNGLDETWAKQVIETAHKHGTLVIFDEVVTGFRYAPGGAQEWFGVTPDLTTLAKILAGGYPGGAVCGRADIVQLFDFHDDNQSQRFKRIAHPGTYNANPVSAAAGVACLEIVRDPSVQDRAAATADKIRAGFREVLRRRGVEGSADGWRSMIPVAITPKVGAREFGLKFRAAMQLGGVDPSGTQLIVSAVHDDEDVERTVAAFDATVERLQGEGVV